MRSSHRIISAKETSKEFDSSIMQPRFEDIQEIHDLDATQMQLSNPQGFGQYNVSLSSDLRRRIRQLKILQRIGKSRKLGKRDIYQEWVRKETL